MNSTEAFHEAHYKDFQEWLSRCPIKITKYIDNYTEFSINFSMDFKNESSTK